MYATKLPFTLTLGALLGNHYYFHRHKINITLGLEEMPEIPTIHNDPPTFTVNSSFENRIDKIISDIEHYTSQISSQPLFEDYKYKGDYTLKDNMAIPHGSGSYEMGEAQISGNFQNGNLSGPFELFSREQDMKIKGEIDGDKLSGQTVAYSKGCKFEMDIKTRSYILTDQVQNKVYVQKMPGNSSITKFYNKEGRKLYSEYKDNNGDGTREVYEEDGSKLTVEMKNGDKEGTSMYVDKYGDAVYTGSFKNGEIAKNWYCYQEIASVLGISFMMTFWPRNPKRIMSHFGGLMLRKLKLR